MDAERFLALLLVLSLLILPVVLGDDCVGKEERAGCDCYTNPETGLELCAGTCVYGCAGGGGWAG